MQEDIQKILKSIQGRIPLTDDAAEQVVGGVCPRTEITMKSMFEDDHSSLEQALAVIDCIFQSESLRKTCFGNDSYAAVVNEAKFRYKVYQERGECYPRSY